MIDNVLETNIQPMYFTCPEGTSASTIRLTPGTVENGYAQLAEIEVFIV